MMLFYWYFVQQLSKQMKTHGLLCWTDFTVMTLGLCGFGQTFCIFVSTSFVFEAKHYFFLINLNVFRFAFLYRQ